MFAIIGANGKVGFATCSALRKSDMPVRAIVRDASKAGPLREIGCEVVVADLKDSTTLAEAIGQATAVQVILPPNPNAADGAQEMREDIESLARALEGAKHIRRILVISDYGAHITHDIGMPTMCRALEERLGCLEGCKKIFLRSAEHIENWARLIPIAIATRALPSFHDPVDLMYPTISASDLGMVAAELLLHWDDGDADVTIVHAEGPQRYSANDVAAALGKLLGKAIRADAIPRPQWKATLERGMSPSLAGLLIKANDANNAGGLIEVEPGSERVEYGKTGLLDALRPLLSS